MGESISDPNPDGFNTLFKEIKKIKHKKLILVVGFSKDKDVKNISKLINKNADTVILTESKNDRSLKSNEVKKYFKETIIIKNPNNALKYAKKIKEKDDLILVAGSIYVVGEIL